MNSSILAEAISEIYLVLLIWYSMLLRQYGDLRRGKDSRLDNYSEIIGLGILSTKCMVNAAL